MIAAAGALLAWAIVPAGAGGQQYPLPTTTNLPETPPLLTPFPITRIVGRPSARGAKITLFTVRAAVGSYVVTRCSGVGKRCPYKQRSMRIPGPTDRIRTIHVRAFERPFRAGVLLRVYVVDTGRTGKYTSFRIRSRLSPRRSDGCVADIVLRPVDCPAG